MLVKADADCGDILSGMLGLLHSSAGCSSSMSRRPPGLLLLYASYALQTGLTGPSHAAAAIDLAHACCLGNYVSMAYA